MFPVMVAVLTNTFDGAALVRTVLPQPDIEEQRIPLLMALLGGLQLEGAPGC
jgi:hypothetical protein